MERIDFDKTKPDFINGDFKWYIDKHFQNYIENEQISNLPKLQGIGCFVVKSIDIEDYVLIDDKQNVIAGYPYTVGGYDQMEARINIIKISKHFDENEKVNV
jgi:hypothetical protein